MYVILVYDIVLDETGRYHRLKFLRFRNGICIIFRILFLKEN